MRLFLLASLLLLSACGGSRAPTGTTPIVEDGEFRVLVYSRTAGFRHASIEPGIAALGELGRANGFAVDASEDPTVFNPETLARYAAVIWLNTTLTVLDTEAQREALQRYIEAGGGYVGIHSAADTEHDWPWYGELVGAYFKSHPVQQLGRLRIEAADHPAVAALPDPWTVFDEFYSFKTNPRGLVRVLMNIDETSYAQDPNTTCLPDSPTFPNGFSGVMGDHPMSWCHDRLGGRAWYTALGHEAALYQLPEFREHLLQGILTATRRVAADCQPREAALPPPPPESPQACASLLPG